MENQMRNNIMKNNQLSTALVTTDNKNATITNSSTSTNRSNSFTYITPQIFSSTFYGVRLKKVIYNDPATIIYWTDNTKTVVKTCKEDTFPCLL